MNSLSSELDGDELLHLALKASEEQKTDEAIKFLKNLLEKKPNNGKAWYFLGALHAEIGLYDRAIIEMEKAVKLDADLYAAHFQLGLLYITSGRVEESINAWKPLDILGPESPLNLFRSGLINLANDNFDQCIVDLTKGIALNTSNKPMNKDMQGIIELAKSALEKKATESSQVDRDDKKNKNHHIFLTAYQDGDKKDN